MEGQRGKRWIAAAIVVILVIVGIRGKERAGEIQRAGKSGDGDGGASKAAAD